jgi:2-iminobutanoate/2-iminopropanoate deaminase
MTRSLRAAWIATVLVVALACSVEQRTDREPAAETATPRREAITPEGVARLPIFSSAMRSGNLIFLSGQIGAMPGVDPPRVVEGGVEAETRQTLDNIVAVLGAAGAGLDDLLKCTVFLADIEDYATVNAIYAEYMPDPPPARSAVAGSGLALGALVEIECIAAAPEGS